MSDRQAKRERRKTPSTGVRNLRDHAALKEDLREQLAFLRDSAAAYDAGVEREGKRLAVGLRTLLHDTDQQTSLLTQLGVLDLLKFADTAIAISPGNLVTSLDFVMVEWGPEGTRYRAPLSDLSPVRLNPPKPFTPWWTDMVTKLTDRSEHSRKDWVLGIADREGGAHVDPRRDPLYEAVTRGDGMRWVAEGNIALATVRQVAHEVELTLAEQLPMLIPHIL